MPITRSIERNSLSLPNSPQRTYTLTSHLPTQREESQSMQEKPSNRKSFDSPRKFANTMAKPLISSSSIPQSSQSSRRLTTYEASGPMRGRSNTDVGSSSTNTIKQQQQTIGGSGSDRYINHHNSRAQSPPIPPKPKCILPTTTSQPGYVTPSKLFNMMGYGLEKQYLFMLAHYLYLIDCRAKEKFNENHIITGRILSHSIERPTVFLAIHWEDALNGNVYISVVERFSEIVLYDDKGIFFNTTTEMRRVNNRFAAPGGKSCLTLSGGFEAFHTFFPFLCTQTDIRSTVDREKFLTIYPSVVLDNQLYLGKSYLSSSTILIQFYRNWSTSNQLESCS